MMTVWSERKSYKGEIKPIMLTQEVEKEFRDFIVAAGNSARVLMQYDGVQHESKCKHMIWILERFADDYHIEVLPHALTATSCTKWHQKEYVKFNQNGDIKVITAMLRASGVSHVIVFSDDFASKLIDAGYNLLKKLHFDKAGIGTFVATDELLVNEMSLLVVPDAMGNVVSEVDDSERPVEFRLQHSSMVIMNPTPSSDLIVKYRYDPRWRAFQNGVQLSVQKHVRCELPFMLVGPIENHDEVDMIYEGTTRYLR